LLLGIHHFLFFFFFLFEASTGFSRFFFGVLAFLFFLNRTAPLGGISSDLTFRGAALPLTFPPSFHLCGGCFFSLCVSVNFLTSLPLFPVRDPVRTGALQILSFSLRWPLKFFPASGHFLGAGFLISFFPGRTGFSCCGSLFYAARCVFSPSQLGSGFCVKFLRSCFSRAANCSSPLCRGIFCAVSRATGFFFFYSLTLEWLPGCRSTWVYPPGVIPSPNNPPPSRVCLDSCQSLLSCAALSPRHVVFFFFVVPLLLCFPFFFFLAGPFSPFPLYFWFFSGFSQSLYFQVLLSGPSAGASVFPSIFFTFPVGFFTSVSPLLQRLVDFRPTPLFFFVLLFLFTLAPPSAVTAWGYRFGFFFSLPVSSLPVPGFFP